MGTHATRTSIANAPAAISAAMSPPDTVNPFQPGIGHPVGYASHLADPTRPVTVGHGRDVRNVITETTRPAQLGADTAPAADSYVHLRVCVAGRRSMRSNTERPTSVGAQPAGGDARVDGVVGSIRPGSVVGGGGPAQADAVTIRFI